MNTRRMIFFARFWLLVFLSCSIPALGQVEGIHLSWHGGDATTGSMAITWSQKELTTGIVKYGVDGKLLQTQRAEVMFSAAMSTHIYKAVLTGLAAGSRYSYRCGSEEKGWSEQYSFKTAPKTGKATTFVVGVWGDTQDNEFNTTFEKSDGIVGHMLNYPIDFTIHMGDIVNNGSQAASWKRFFEITQPINAVSPFMPVTGNHDVINDAEDTCFQKPFPVFHDLFNLPGNNINYSFDYGNAHFIAINSGFAKEAEKLGRVLFQEGSAEYRWLDEDLRQARRNRKIRWIILYTHYPFYSYGWSNVPAWRDRITPLLDKYEVDLCLAGHRHVYERHAAIRANRVLHAEDDRSYMNPAGTVYITNGTAGGSPQGVGGYDLPSMIFTPRERMYNFAIMSIDGNVLRYAVYNDRNEVIDSFEIVK